MSDDLRLPCPVCDGDLYLFIMSDGIEAWVKCEGCGNEWDTTGPLTRRTATKTVKESFDE